MVVAPSRQKNIRTVTSLTDEGVRVPPHDSETRDKSAVDVDGVAPTWLTCSEILRKLHYNNIDSIAGNW